MGYSTRTIEDFIEILSIHGIELLVDVRRFPKSKREEYNRNSLERTLKEYGGISYEWFEDLGGFRKGGYAAYVTSEDYSEAIDRLIHIARRNVIAIMCAEKLWFRCHRRYIADSLVRRGMKVCHIVDKNRLYTHKIMNV